MNKVQKAAKEAIEEAAEGIGGTARLIEWIKEDPKNESIFWGTIYPKLLPLTAQLTGDGSAVLSMKVEFVSPERAIP